MPLALHGNDSKSCFHVPSILAVSYPAIKIGRLAVDLKYEGQGIGRELMKQIKESVAKGSKVSAFRFLTVDAYLSAVPFYEKNGFKMLLGNDENKHTRAMYFDMLELD